MISHSSVQCALWFVTGFLQYYKARWSWLKFFNYGDHLRNVISWKLLKRIYFVVGERLIIGRNATLFETLSYDFLMLNNLETGKRTTIRKRAVIAFLLKSSSFRFSAFIVPKADKISLIFGFINLREKKHYLAHTYILECFFSLRKKIFFSS